jgi:hypothetical protein
MEMVIEAISSATLRDKVLKRTKEDDAMVDNYGGRGRKNYGERSELCEKVMSPAF